MLKIIRKHEGTIGICLLFLLSAVLITVPNFFSHYFKLTLDGYVHLNRFQGGITDAIRQLQVPLPINMIGFSNVGAAFNSAYPWMAGWVFILPELIFNNPLHALFVGLVLLNFITALNAYFLMRKVANNQVIRILGAFLYEFNTYHLIIVFGRNAFGEALAYAFIPLAILGLLEIMRLEKVGIFNLAFGMGMIINSHILSTILTVVALAVLLGINYRQITNWLMVIRYIFYAIIVTFLFSGFTIINFLTIFLKNKLSSPPFYLLPIAPDLMSKAVINNTVTDYPYSWNLGIVLTIILIMMLIQVAKRKADYNKYVIVASLLFICMFNWFVPVFDQIQKTGVGALQFTGRLLSYSAIFLIIGFCMYLDQVFPLKQKQVKKLAGVISLIIFACGFMSVWNYHRILNDSSVRLALTRQNYNDAARHNPFSFEDYLPKNTVKIIKKQKDKVRVKAATTTAITFKLDNPDHKEVTLPFAFYNGIKYTSSKKLIKAGHVNLRNTKANGELKISVKPASAYIGLFVFTVIVTLLGSLFVLVVNTGRLKTESGVSQTVKQKLR
ncbi:YfhO family protein [Limosilactobacillus antri]|uniref:YfhO family protein n=1 Tax=Limosilactobacillus antri TaxID=227943 RepID=UPI001F591645|nr:YfhO family protein [Limosilactobacillus antri]